jgi:hypothetical protein
VGRLAQGLQAAETGGYYIIGKNEKQIKKRIKSTTHPVVDTRKRRTAPLPSEQTQGTINRSGELLTDTH